MRRRIIFAAIALASAALGAHTLNPRELFHEMYPLEPVKQDAFHICDQTDPTFVRAVGADREACYNKMPHIMAVAMGRITPGGALTTQALTDPSREAELLMMLAAMPPRQPIITPRSFSDTAWMHALSCGGVRALAALAYAAPAGLPPPPGSGRAVALDSVVAQNLPLPPRAVQTGVAGTARRDPLPVLSLTGSDTGLEVVPATSGVGSPRVAAEPLPAPDVGDEAPPAIVPLMSADRCSGA